MIFNTSNCDHLVEKIGMPRGKAIIKTFADGELYVKIEEDVAGKNVWVLADTQPPADNYMQLFFLLDALKRAGAQVNLIITYFGYARQDRAEHGEVFSSEVICNMLRLFSSQSIAVVHLHNPLICSFLPIKNIIPYDFFCDIAQEFDCIAAPDTGAEHVVHAVCDRTGKECVLLQKKRINGKPSITSISGDVQGKSVLIVDDMISTGGTIIKAAQFLKDNGAKKIVVAATHGIFAGDALTKIQNSVIEHVWVTDTVPQKKHAKVTIVSVASELTRYMQ